MRATGVKSTRRRAEFRLAALRAAHELARASAGGAAFALGDHAGDDGGVIAVDLLQQPPSADRQVVMHFRWMQMQSVVVDDVDVGLVTRREQTAIVEAD